MKIFLYLFLLCFSFSVLADDAKQEVSHSLPETGHWLFSGLINNENNEQYAYLYAVDKVNSLFAVRLSVVNVQTKEALFVYQGLIQKAAVKDEGPWNIGNAVFNFDPITKAMLLGYKDEKGNQLNLKIDTLSSENLLENRIELIPLVNFKAIQSGRVNGHLKLSGDNKEQFVTGNRNWIALFIEEGLLTSTHNIDALFCNFTDGNSFYSVTAPEESAKNAMMTRWFDNKGAPVIMSQFIKIIEDRTMMHIDISKPKLKIDLNNLVLNNDGMEQVFAGLVNQENSLIYCSKMHYEFLSRAAEDNVTKENQDGSSKNIQRIMPAKNDA